MEYCSLGAAGAYCGAPTTKLGGSVIGCVRKILFLLTGTTVEAAPNFDALFFF